jgi:hypothetical protein
MSLSLSASQGSESAIEKKRLFAEERAARLRDPKQRQLGIDRSALDEQVREKEEVKKLETERGRFFDKQALLMDKHAQNLQNEVDAIKARREKDLVDYRATFQKREDRREWDLNDPKRVTTDLPARVNDADPRNGPSGLQRFDGEDLDFTDRKKAQQHQLKDWVQQQVDEKLVKKWMEGEADRTFESRSEETNYRVYQIEQTVAQQRRQQAVNQAQFNKALAEQKKREQVKVKGEQTQKNLEEIGNMLNSDFLNEREGLVTDLGEKVKAERFKGFTGEQRRKIIEEQCRQQEELRQRKLQEADEERQWSQQENMQNRLANALDRQRERERRAEAERVSRNQEQQARQATEKKQNLDKVYANAVSESYFKHWGKCL